MEDNVSDYSKEELFKWFTTDNKSGYKSTEKWLKKHQPDLFYQIINNSEEKEISFINKILLYINNLTTLPLCPVCGNKCNSKGSVLRGLANFCTSNCSNKSILTKIKKDFVYKSEEYVKKSSERRSNAIKTFNEKYGVDNPFKLVTIRNKAKETNLTKYGVENTFQSKFFKDKIKLTNLKKYGVEHLAKSFEHHSKKVINARKTCELKFRNMISKSLKLQLDDIKINNDVIIISNYCKKHDKFEITKNSFYSRMRGGCNICTKCFPIGDLSSISEIELFNYISDELKYNCKKKKINNKEIDIYIDSVNIGIEYNGLFWHSNKFLNNNYHVNKTELCETNNVQLLHVFEDEWINKKDIVKSIIKHKLGVIENCLQANLCDVRHVENKALIEFLNNNYIYENITGKIKLGLYYNNELMSIMIFNKKYEMNGKYEILGFCNKINYNVMGGVNTLIDYFKKVYQPTLITILVDRRYSQGKQLECLGFKYVKNIKPNYWYFKTSKILRYNKANFTKKILTNKGHDQNKTEFEIMDELGYLRIYDCGYAKFELKLE